MENKVTDKQTAEYYSWGNHCLGWILAESDMLSIKQELMPGKTREQLHFHEHACQFFFILRGRATFHAENRQHELKEQQGIMIPPATRHFIANETNEELEFLVISQPLTSNDRINI